MGGHLLKDADTGHLLKLPVTGHLAYRAGCPYCITNCVTPETLELTFSDVAQRTDCRAWNFEETDWGRVMVPPAEGPGYPSASIQLARGAGSSCVWTYTNDFATGKWGLWLSATDCTGYPDLAFEGGTFRVTATKTDGHLRIQASHTYEVDEEFLWAFDVTIDTDDCVPTGGHANALAADLYNGGFYDGSVTIDVP